MSKTAGKKWFTFIFMVNMNRPNEGQNERPYVVYQNAYSYSGAVKRINKRVVSPWILACFPGKLHPVQGEVWNTDLEKRIVVKGAGAGMAMVSVDSSPEKQTLGWVGGPLGENEQKNLSRGARKTKKALAKRTAAP
jgi:hypothetical protein